MKINALHLYDGDTKLREYSVSGTSGSIEYMLLQTEIIDSR